MPQILVVAVSRLEYSHMSKFIQSFKQYLLGEADVDDEDREKIRHAKVKRREQEIHQRVLSTGDKEGEEAEKTRHRTSKKGEQQRHVANPRSTYKRPGHRTTSEE